jgi:hypothetical protein
LTLVWAGEEEVEVEAEVEGEAEGESRPTPFIESDRGKAAPEEEEEGGVGEFARLDSSLQGL